MAVISSNNQIIMHRGDSFIIPVELNIGTGCKPKYYSLTESDVVYFGLMEPNQQ